MTEVDGKAGTRWHGSSEPRRPCEWWRSYQDGKHHTGSRFAGEPGCLNSASGLCFPAPPTSLTFWLLLWKWLPQGTDLMHSPRTFVTWHRPAPTLLLPSPTSPIPIHSDIPSDLTSGSICSHLGAFAPHDPSIWKSSPPELCMVACVCSQSLRPSLTFPPRIAPSPTI